MRRFKTKLTKADLQKPAIDVTKAVQEDRAAPTASGAFLLPEDQEIAKSLTAAPVKAVSNDWMKIGDPNAPAIRELEEKARQAREQALLAAQPVNNPMMPMGGGPVGTISQPLEPPIQPATSPARDTGTTHFPWAPGQPATPVVQEDGVEEFAQDMGMTYHMSDPAAPGTVPAQPLPPAPVTAQATATDDGMVLRIPHDPSELLNRPAPEPEKTQLDNLGGMSVKIDHDSTMDTLPYSPPVRKTDPRDNL